MAKLPTLVRCFPNGMRYGSEACVKTPLGSVGGELQRTTILDFPRYIYFLMMERWHLLFPNFYSPKTTLICSPCLPTSKHPCVLENKNRAASHLVSGEFFSSDSPKNN
jgi:hypothetical protein